MRPQGVSIVICCHNGERRMSETIRHIAQQDVSTDIPWELLIVDNGCTDESVAIAREAWKKHNAAMPLKIVYEPVLGLSHARARGFSEARYEYIVMCDDDNWLERDYVASVYRIMSQNRNIGALGGFGKLAFEIEPVVPELTYIFAAGPQAARSGKVRENRLYGAGCVIRSSAYERLLATGFKSLLTDRRGAELTSGGDYELCLALAIIGYDICYDESLRFTHFITRERLSWDYFLKFAQESSKSFNVISSYKMVACNTTMSSVALLAVIRNFLVCSRIFLAITMKRLLFPPEYAKRSLHFRHLVFGYKLIAYFIRFRQIVNTHRFIVNFRRSCSKSRSVLAPVERRGFPAIVKLSSYSRPSRQLR